MMRVAVIGGGPAGLAAATELARRGVQVDLLDRLGQAGGVPRLCGHSPFGMREFGRILSGNAYANRLVSMAKAAGVRIHNRHAVTGIEDDLTLRLSTPDGAVTLPADAVVLATGIREASRAERLLPGDRPLGVVTTGALQDLWFARGARPFRRPVILGQELVAMSAILTCRQMGTPALALIRASKGPVAAAPLRWLPHVLRIPVIDQPIIDLIARDGRLDRIVLSDREIAADGLVLTGDWRPEVGLARISGIAIDQATGGPAVDAGCRTSRAGVYACGNVLRGVRTAGQCWSEGRAIAATVLADAGLSRDKAA